MSIFGRVLFFILLGALFVQFLIGFPILLEQRPEPINLATAREYLDSMSSGREQLMGQIHLVESREGDRDWELFAEQARGSEMDGKWNLTQVRVQLYSQDRLEFTIVGAQGVIDTKTKDIKVFGKVLTRSAQGAVFETEEVNFEAKGRVLTSPLPVKMRSPPDAEGGVLHVQGGSLIAAVDEGSAVLQPAVQARRTYGNGKFIDLKAGGCRIDRKTFAAEFFNKVQVSVDSMRIEGPEARLEYRSGSNILDRVSLRGGVRISDVDKFGSAETVRFEPEKAQFTLSGRPRLVRNQDEITGEEIILLEGGQRVKVKGMKARVEEGP